MSLFRSFSRKHGRISKEVLERSLNTKEGEKIPLKPGRPTKNAFHRNRLIVTLDPNKFVEMKQKCLHIGKIQSFRPRISLLKHSTPVVGPELCYDQSVNLKASARRLYHSYPLWDLKAFLYYYMSPVRPRIAGELRLRVASSDDPASFESGSDLLLPNGRAWTRPLYLVSKYYLSLYDKLREDRLIPDDLHAYLSTLPAKRHNLHRSRVLYTFNDAFIIDFSTSAIFFVLTEQGIVKLPFDRIFYDAREICNYHPYSGTAWVRFERSRLLEHKGTRTVVIRIIKIITPVKCVISLYDDYICFPRAGELHQRFSGKDQSVWSVNIDKSKSTMLPGLRLLWDA